MENPGKTNENPHVNHRKRLRDRFELEGSLDSFPDHNVLELLLFYAIPRCDTNKIAHELLREFGTLTNVFGLPARPFRTDNW